MTRLHQFIELEEFKCHVCRDNFGDIQKLQEHFDEVHRPSIYWGGSL